MFRNVYRRKVETWRWREGSRTEKAIGLISADLGQSENQSRKELFASRDLPVFSAQAK